VAEIIDDDPKTIRTKGDANPSSIPGTDFPITDEEYIGKVAYVIPQIGYITRILMPPVNYIIIAVIVGILIFKQISKNKKTKETSLLAEYDVTNETFQKSTSESLTNLPKDNEYTEFERVQNSDTVNQAKKSDSKEKTDD
jgi:signal peptidase